MDIALTILSVFLAVVLLISAFGKFTRQEQVVQNLTAAGVKLDQFPALAALEIVGAIGLIVGLFWNWAMIAAGIGVALYFAGAVTAHLRAGDRQIVPAGALLVLSVAVVVLALL